MPIFNMLFKIITPLVKRENASILLLVVFFSLWLNIGQLSNIFSILIIFLAFALIALMLAINKVIFASNKIATVLLFFYIYSAFLFLIYQPNNLEWSILIAHLVSISLLIFSHDKKFIFNENKLFVALFFTAAISTILNIIDGKLILDTSNLSLKLAETDTSNSDGAYNKPLTRVYGILIILLVFSKKIPFIKITGFIVLFYLALAGGGRAELLFLVLTLLIYKPSYFFGLFVLLFLLVFLGVDFMILAENSIGLLRVLDSISIGEFSTRINLYLLSLELLNNNPKCLTLGCGITYFQAYNNLELGLYPHNIILELLISFGLPLTFLVIYVINMELRKKISKTQLALIIYLLGQSLLSGTLLTSYFLILLLSLRPAFNGRS